jgi:phosphoribosylanthranilate isomerase
MALITKVKAGSITNLSDARYFSALGVSWIGFALEEDSSKAIDPKTVNEMLEWLYGPTITGEFTNKPMREVNHLVAYLQLGAVQLGPAYSAEDCHEAAVPVIKEVALTHETTYQQLTDTLTEYYNSATYFLLNGRSHNIGWNQLRDGHPADTDQLRYLCQQFPVLLDLPFSDETVLDVLEEIQPAGINLTGGEEIEVGVKQFDELDAVMEKLEVDE